MARTKKKNREVPLPDDDVREERGLGPNSAGQTGELQGQTEIDDADTESVEELIEDGQALEAEAVEGVEDASDADVKEVHVHERPEDDVPEEYLDRD